MEDKVNKKEKAMIDKQKVVENAVSALNFAEGWTEYAAHELRKLKDEKEMRQAKEVKEKARSAQKRISKLSNS